MRFSALLLLLGLTGCGDIFGNQTATTPGADIGTFAVTATTITNTCGANAFGAPPTWDFSVQLSRAPGAIYWNAGQGLISGTLAADNMSFLFETSTVTNMRSSTPTDTSSSSTGTFGEGGAASTPPGLPCSIARDDTATGLLSSATVPVASFSGSLTYAFSPTAGSSCEDLVTGATPIAAALPCTISYTMSALQTAAPTTAPPPAH